MEDNFGDDHAQSTSKEVSSIPGPALAISSSQPSDSGRGNGKMEEPKKEEEVPNSKVTTNGMLMNSPPTNEAIYGRLNLLKEPITARLEELTTMDPTVEVALEIADSLHLLNLMKCGNQDMKKAGDWGRGGARHLREGAQLVTESRQILRSAILNDQNPFPLSFHTKKTTGMVVMNGRPTKEGIYAGLKVLKEPVMARLEVLMSMDSTAEVGLEIADSVHHVNLINSANHEMGKACERAGRGASLSIEGAKLVSKSQQILRSSTLNEQKSDDEEEILVAAGSGPQVEYPLENYGVYASVKSRVGSSSASQVTHVGASQGSSTNQVTDAGASSSHATSGS